jgi:hypothetical protein
MKLFRARGGGRMRGNPSRPMERTFQYLVCQVQKSLVTFGNGQWQGTVPLDCGDPQKALDSCPLMWVFLQEAGKNGWELVSAVDTGTPENHYQILFLKR